MPNPDLYNNHYIHKYAIPNGLQSHKLPQNFKSFQKKVSIFDLKTNLARKGVSGWKLQNSLPSPHRSMPRLPPINSNQSVLIKNSSVSRVNLKLFDDDDVNASMKALK